MTTAAAKTRVRRTSVRHRLLRFERQRNRELGPGICVANLQRAAGLCSERANDRHAKPAAAEVPKLILREARPAIADGQRDDVSRAEELEMTMGPPVSAG